MTLKYITEYLIINKVIQFLKSRHLYQMTDYYIHTLLQISKYL